MKLNTNSKDLTYREGCYHYPHDICANELIVDLPFPQDRLIVHGDIVYRDFISCNCSLVAQNITLSKNEGDSTIHSSIEVYGNLLVNNHVNIDKNSIRVYGEFVVHGSVIAGAIDSLYRVLVEGNLECKSLKASKCDAFGNICIIGNASVLSGICSHCGDLFVGGNVHVSNGDIVAKNIKADGHIDCGRAIIATAEQGSIESNRNIRAHLSIIAKALVASKGRIAAQSITTYIIRAGHDVEASGEIHAALTLNDGSETLGMVRAGLEVTPEDRAFGRGFNITCSKFTGKVVYGKLKIKENY